MSETGAECFKQEAMELLVKLEDVILDLEQNPDDKDSIDGLFRIIHTLKGSGAMFGFDKMVRLAHNLETVIEIVREGRIRITAPLISLVLNTRDQIKALIMDSGDDEIIEHLIYELKLLKTSMEAGEIPQEPPDDSNGDPFLIPEKEQEPKPKYFRIRFYPDTHVFRIGMDPGYIIQELASLGECSKTVHVESIPLFSRLNPENCYFSWDFMLLSKKSKERIKDVFIFVEHNSRIIIHEYGTDDVDSENPNIPLLGEILVQRGDIEPEKVAEVLQDRKRIGELLVEKGSVSPSKVKSALNEQKALSDLKGSTAGIRVDSLKIDHLVNLVGELVIAKERLLKDAVELREFQELNIFNTIEEVERLSDDLRDCALEMRMLPIGGVFGKYRRVVRDLSMELGKEIRLITEGGETELDKNIIERLNDPLVHLIRNSIDHGIEPPDVRARNNRSRTGTIRLSAAYKGAYVVITIEDDGVGMDSQAILDKAVRRSLVSPDMQLSEQEILHLIFQPGFSTVEQVTRISGRGVGMDVVKREIDSLGGSIRIDSRKGEGTSIHLSIPLTLAIIDGLLVSVADRRYVLQLSQVKECSEISDAIMEKVRLSNMLPYRDGIIPLVRLRDIFRLDDTPPKFEKLAVIGVEDELIGVIVDDIIGNLQTVIKTLDKKFDFTDGISAATILGDGTVALILDARGLMQWTYTEEKRKIRFIGR